MAPMIDNHWLLPIAAGLAAGWLYIVAYGRRRRIQVEADYLRLAADQLEAYYDAVEAFVDDPAAPADLKETILFVGEITSDRALSAVWVDKLKAVAPKLREIAKRPPASTLDGSIERLAKSRPDLVHLYVRAISAAQIAIFYRWPEFRSQAFECLPWLSIDHSAQLAATAALNETKAAKSNHFAGGMPLPA